MPAQNPILPGFHPDPSICRVGADYYLTTSTFEWFPGLPIYHSRDLVHWRLLGHALTRDAQLPLQDAKPSKGLWAPTIRWHAGTFYLVGTNTSLGGTGNFLVTASDPAGPWSDLLPLAIEGIDPSLLFASDGRTYLTTSENRQAEIDPRTGALRSPIRRIWDGTDGGYMEAPHLFQRGPWYYLLVAEGGTGKGHMVTIARATSPWGPFTPCPHNPILTHRHRGGTLLQCMGHADFVDDPAGNTWAVFLGVRTTAGMFPRYHILGRETFLAPVTWTADGWPLINGGEEIGTTLDSPLLPPPQPWPEEPVAGGLRGFRPGIDATFLRNPARERYDLVARPGWLRLHAAAGHLDDLGAPCAVFRRLTAHHGVLAVELDADSTPGSEAGVTLYANHRHHLDCFLAAGAGGRVVRLRPRVCELAPIQAEVAVGAGPVVLEITSHPDRFVFAVIAATTRTVLGELSSKLISTEVASGFTGAMVGLYAHDPAAALVCDVRVVAG